MKKLKSERDFSQSNIASTEDCGSASLLRQQWDNSYAKKSNEEMATMFLFYFWGVAACSRHNKTNKFFSFVSDYFCHKCNGRPTLSCSTFIWPSRSFQRTFHTRAIFNWATKHLSENVRCCTTAGKIQGLKKSSLTFKIGNRWVPSLIEIKI